VLDALTTAVRQQASAHPAALRRLDIQGLRGLAVLLVVCFHAGLPVPGGFVGVDVFFVISGFVITEVLLRQWRELGRLDLRTFYVRRIRRLLPALSVVVCVTCVASVLLEPPNGQQQTTAQTALGAMMLSANIAIPRLALDYFAPLASTNPLLHTWSLSAEEQFYLAFPTLLYVGLALTRRSSRLSGAMVLVGCGSAVSLTLLMWMTYFGARQGSIAIVLDPFYSSMTRAWEFGVGALTALSATTLLTRGGNVLRFAGTAGLLAVIGSSRLITPATTFPGTTVIVPVVGTALMLAAALNQQNLVARILRLKPLVAFGDLSYSWYLWHWPVITFGRLLAPDVTWLPLACASASLAPACISYRFVENPIRFSTRLHGAALAVVISISIALPIAIGGTLGFGARHGWGLEWALGTHTVMQRGCGTGDFDPVRCKWSVPNATGSVVLLGDSQSWAIADGLIPAAASLGLNTIVWSQNSCPFLSIDAPSLASVLTPVCASRNEARLRFAESYSAIAVIANMSLLEYAPVPEESWRQGLATAVRRLQSSRVNVILVTPAPYADATSRRFSLLIRAPGDRYTPLEAHITRQRTARLMELMIASENPDIVTFDPATVLCDDRRCSVARNGLQFYSDQNHLSRSGALLLIDGFRDALSRALMLQRKSAGASAVQ
jgi:peptidoglycan/LPS O-acetylase OafA/YrhL